MLTDIKNKILSILYEKTGHYFIDDDLYYENAFTKNMHFKCSICNCYLHLSIDLTDNYPPVFILLKYNELYSYWFNIYINIKKSFNINEFISCNDVIIKNILE